MSPSRRIPARDARAFLSGALRRARTVAPAIAVLLSLHAAQAQQIALPWRELPWNDAFQTFDSSRYVLGSATSHDAAAGNIILTPERQTQSGRIFLRSPRPTDIYDLAFDAFFGVRTPAHNGGADGIVFVTAASPTYPESSGGQLDVEGCGGYGMEFDTYMNVEENDPSEEHIGLIANSAANHLHTETLVPGTLKNGAWHSIRIVNRSGAFRVYLDGVDRFSYTVTGYSPRMSWFGFTASTGTSYNEHRLDNVSLSLPSRVRTDLGSFASCDTVRLFPVIAVRNNHPSQAALTISSLTFTELDGSGEFTIGAVPVPASIAYMDSLVIPVRFAGASSGVRRAVVTLTATNGETISDTLAVTLGRPVVEWQPAAVVFPRTHRGASSTRRVVLRNTGTVPAVIDSLGVSGPFTILAPRPPMPATLPAGDSLVLSMEFTAPGTGTFTGSVWTNTSCGDRASAPLIGDGYVVTLNVELDRPVMLVPGTSSPVFARIHDPGDTVRIRSVTMRLRYDAGIARFLSLRTDSTPAARGIQFTATEPSGPGVIVVSMQSSRDLPLDGRLFSLLFTPSRPDTGCTDIEGDGASSLAWNAFTTQFGTPGGVVVPGGMCVNPSCRIPEGLVTLGRPAITNDPNPFNPSTVLRVTMPNDGPARLTVSDAAGRIVATVFDGGMTRGEHAIRFDAATLPTGTYIATLTTPDGMATRAMVLLR